jgi:hypothetical protein
MSFGVRNKGSIKGLWNNPWPFSFISASAFASVKSKLSKTLYHQGIRSKQPPGRTEKGSPGMG